MSGAGAAGTAIARLIVAGGARHLVVADIRGVINAARADMDPSLQWIADHTNEEAFEGTLKEAVKGADVFIGVSAPNILSEEDIEAMARGAIVFALANPDPEIDPGVARRHAAVVATGRSDVPNQINNVLAFPGVFRGLLDASATMIEQPLLVAAANAIASSVTDSELNANYVIPSVFHEDVHKRVAAAVKRAAVERGSG